MLELKRAFTDGTTHVLFEPEDFIARLAASDLNLSAEFIGPSILRSLLDGLVREFDTKSNNRE